MTEYEKLLDRMHFEIGSTLMDNSFSRKGVCCEPQSESEILRSNRRTYMNLKVMMMRLERALFGEKTYEEENKPKIPNRNTSGSEDTDVEKQAARSPRIGDFSC